MRGSYRWPAIPIGNQRKGYTMSAMALLLHEQCNNPKCPNKETMMSGSGVRFVFRGMEYAFHDLECAETYARRLRGDKTHIIQELARARLVAEGKIHELYQLR